MVKRKWTDVKGKPTEKRLKYLIQDEQKASNEYKKYGFKSLSNDEKRHKKFLERKLKDDKKRIGKQFLQAQREEHMSN